MPPELFDMRLRALRRDRAARLGPELFLHERAFADTLERLELVNRRFASALLVGCPDPGWPERLTAFAARVTAVDPGPLFAKAVGGECIIEESWSPPIDGFDLCVALGTLDTINDVPRALRVMRQSLRPDSLLIGAAGGGDTLPRLRQAMHAADQVTGVSSPHVHPRLAGPTLGALLGAAGFIIPVVDIDRVHVTYRSFDRLVSDLRRMSMSNILCDRSRLPLSRRARFAAAQAFEVAGNGLPTNEIFEILYFAAWTAPGPSGAAEHG